MAEGDVTFLTLKKRALAQADLLNSTFISSTDDADGYNELDDLMNNSIRWLYHQMVHAWGDDAFATEHEFQGVANQVDYSLPADFWKLLMVDVAEGSSPGVDEWYAVHKYQRQDRNRRYRGLIDYRYRLQSTNIRISPSPDTSVRFRITYAPRFTALSADGDTFAGINGYEDVAVLEAAIRMRIKEQTEVQDLIIERERRLVELKEAVDNRDAHEPEQIEDVERYFDFDDWDLIYG